MVKKIIISLLIFLFSFYLLFSQDESIKRIPLSLGVYAGLNINLHSPNFNYQEIALFNENATGSGGVLGFTGFFPINDNFVIAGRLGFNGLGSLLISDSSELDGSLNYIEISPELQVHNVLPVKNSYLIGGLETGIPLSPRYSISGDSALAIENEIIPDAAFRFAGTIGLGYFYEISDGVNLTPELTLRIPFSIVSDNQDFKTWDVSEIRLSVALSFSLYDSPETTVETYDSFLDAGFDEVRYYDKQGNHYPLERIKVEELKYTEQFPLIPYVFFEKNQAQPPKKYQVLNAKSAAGEFTLQNLLPNSLEINKNLLDIIGTRLENISNSELTIVGVIDNQNEKGNIDLALNRAKFVKDYLTNHYKIEPQRLNVRAEEIPKKPSSLTSPDGIAENRRVELYSSNPKLFEPIIIQKDNQTLAEPNLIEFVPYVKSLDSIVEWKLSITQEGEEIRSFTGTSEPGYIAWVIIPNELVKSQIPIEYILWVKNAEGLEKTVAATIPVDYYSFSRKKTEDLPDQTIAKFSLILFDFDSDKINEKDLEIINRDILPMVNFNSTVKIYGYTDRIGQEEYNKKLSIRRAKAVRDYLKSKVKSVDYEVHGVGENEVLFDNDLPLGRQLSRTVQIYIINPR